MALKSRIPAIAAELRPLVEIGLQEGATLVEGAAKERVPIGDPEEHLQDEIHTSVQPEGVYVIAGGGEHHLFYGHLVEHGTSHSAPHPFLVPALEAKRHEVEALVAAGIRRAVR